ncbi:WD repeat-containing protein slp1 [Fusarium oxysporum f. sp. albedinis]|nr:WD repeat-containing protein slp1 [Fusarium oxysporum f. sp. albedinis]
MGEWVDVAKTGLMIPIPRFSELSHAGSTHPIELLVHFTIQLSLSLFVQTTMNPTEEPSESLPHAHEEEDDDYDDDLDPNDFLVASEVEPDEDHVKAKFELDLEEARKLSKKLLSADLDEEEKKSQRAKFVNDRRAEWSEKTDDERRNFLHYLAEYNYRTHKPPVSLQWVMMQAVRKLPAVLVWSPDNKGRVPLTTALLKVNISFYYSVCLRMRERTYEDYKALMLKKYENWDGGDETTCLHAAAACVADDGKNRQDAFSNMCRFSPRQMFFVRDSKGRTPLHRAVDYEYCCKSQVGVVSELLRTCHGLLDIPIQDPEDANRTISVYQYHHHTRKKVLESRRRHAQDIASQELKSGAPKTVDPRHEKGLDPKKDAKRVSARPEKSGPERSSMGPPPPRDKGDSASKRRGSIALTPQGVTTPLQSPNLAPLTRVKTEAVQKITRPAVADNPLSKEKETQEAANMISDLLKLEALRRQSPEKAAESLRLQDEPGKKGSLCPQSLQVLCPAKEFWFDFGPPNTLSENDFKKHFGHLKFDTALQYVGFPQVRLKGSREQPDVRHQGRKDMVFFFDWLRAKPVTRIIKVVVEDMEKPSHSDEAIEECLKDLGVEILDWRRLDLDALCLRKIGTHLREIHLQWSGSNSTLRAWSEKEGLAMIPTLEVIHLSQDEACLSATQSLAVSRDRTLENIKVFEERLRQSWPEGKHPPKVSPPKTGGGRRVTQNQVPDARPQPLERSIDPHKWMKCMEDFSRRFKQIKALRDTKPSLKPVEVALIDDGVDFMHPDLNDTRDRTFLGKSFDYRDERPTPRVPPYWSSPSGHGTLMARLIHKICPSAVIHVIKLQTFRAGNSDKLQIRTDSAVKAIDYAAERGSQIICMSWTIKPPEGELKGEFNRAILNAIDKHRILIFCAASDQGQSADLSYPHGSSNQCFRIGAAKATGNILETVGDSHNIDFILPGHEVVVDTNEMKTQLEKFEAHSGSSVANGLATGLAALVIECVRLGAIYTRELKRLEPKVRLSIHTRMD